MAMKRKNLPEVVPKFFEHEEFGEIRFIQHNGEIWFVGKDVCRVLGYENSRKALRDHVPDKYKRGERIVTPLGGAQETIFISEPGLYRLIMRSNLPAAEKFMDWVCEEVLPSIRKYGYYVAPNQQVIRIEGNKEFKAFKAQYPEGAVEVKRVLFDLKEYDNGEYDVVTIHEVVLHSNK